MKRSAPASPDLLKHLETSSGRGRGAPWWGKTLLLLVCVAVGVGVYLTTHFAVKVSRALSAVTVNTNTGLFAQIRGLANPPEKPLRGEEKDRINVAILGVGGEGHEGANLTDTMIVASIQPSTKRAALFSIPRDLVVEIPGYGFRKINHANAFGEETTPGGGVPLARSVLETLVGAPIHYMFRVDFNGFEKVIDDLGGVDIVVDQSFVDYEYPTEDYGYQTIRFEAGKQHLDGATALKYVRSRHGNNNEGSDFARSKRQQKVLVALKSRIFSMETLLNPSRITDGLETLGESITTDFEPWELMKLATLGKSIDPDTVTNRVLDTSAGGLLMNTVGIDGAYILEPRSHNTSEIQQAFARLFTTDAPVQARVEIQNGTITTGLAAQTASLIDSDTVHVVRVRNARERNHTQTIMYDLTGGKQTSTLTALRDKLHAVIATSLPDAIGSGGTALNLSDIGSSLTNGETLRSYQTDADYANIDIVLILGTDQALNSR